MTIERLHAETAPSTRRLESVSVFRYAESPRVSCNPMSFKFVQLNRGSVMSNGRKRLTNQSVGIGAGIGVSLGVAVGSVSGEMGESLAAGVALGTLVGAVFDLISNKRKEQPPRQ